METITFPRQSFKALKPKAGKSVKSVKALSLRISDKLNDHTNKNTMFYLKCGWHLTEAQIFGIIERAQGKRSPVGYFLAAAKDEMLQPSTAE